MGKAVEDYWRDWEFRKFARDLGWDQDNEEIPVKSFSDDDEYNDEDESWDD